MGLVYPVNIFSVRGIYTLASGIFLPHKQGMNTRDKLLGLIEEFLNRTGETERQFGIDVVGDHKFVKRLRMGMGITLTSIEKAEAYMAGYPTSKIEAETRRAERSADDAAVAAE